MQKVIVISILALLNNTMNFAQQDVNSLLDRTLSYRGLTREDITIPIDFYASAEKSPVNDSKLLLPLVRDMMINPLRSMTWLDSLDQYLGIDAIRLLFNNMLNQQLKINLIDCAYPYEPDELGKFLVNQITQERKWYNYPSTAFNKEEIKFLRENLFSILEGSEDDDGSNLDIFKYNVQRDSSIAISKRIMDILSKINMSDVSVNSMNLASTYFCLLSSLGHDKIYLAPLISYDIDDIEGDFYFYSEKNNIRIAIGGPGKNIYTGHFDFIIDIGGDDVYSIDNPPLRGGQRWGGFSCIIDISGNDYYTTSSDFALAGGLFASSFIFDKEGDDFYESKGTGNLGAAIGGLGLLYDEKGNDTYKGLSFSIGAACFGVGLLVDREGNDFYIANSYSQGFGMTQGVGCIIDNKGNDSYLIDSRSLDIGRYEDHYVSMCQGYGLGLRPFYAGGIGLIIEGEGNDIYNTDIFGQGGAYWYSLGAIVDKSGHDKYNGYQYSQGAGIHLAVGLLKDYDGWDFYQSNGVSQGCGHDFGYGLLWDVKGNDNYSAFSLSQGAGNANGIGILIDESGTDGYLNKYPNISRGYGNPRREFGSIGIFVDASGTDYYSDPGMDGTLFNSSTWGIMNDLYYTDLPSQVSGDNFKVPMDSVDRPHDIPFTSEQLFIMAKTIEPRFSLWQEYGQKKLIEDSINTAGYVCTKLGTIDARETQVMRALALRIQKPLSNALISKLYDYTEKKIQMTQPEVSLACYLFGECRDASGKDILYLLTYNDSYKIRASAVNALGKIKYDTGDTEFVEKVSKRLSEMANEYSDKKLYNKDIAFALGNYKSLTGFETLRSMLNNSFFGARFVAADNLGKSPFLSNILLIDSRSPDIPQEEIPLIAFIRALENVKESDFQSFIGFIKINPAFGNESVVINLIELVKLRRDNSMDAGFKSWCDAELKELQDKVNLKVR